MSYGAKDATVTGGDAQAALDAGSEPQWESVSSSRFTGMKYDPDQQRLSIRWTNGQVGHYTDVPADEYEKLRLADSLGKYLNTHIIARFQYVPEPKA